MTKLKYKNSGAAEVEATFRELRLFEVPTTDRSEGTTMRKVKYNHRLGIWRTFTLELASDHPDNDVLWIEDFWIAEQTWIEDPKSPGTWLEVVVPSGPCPIVPTEGIVDWPEATIEFTEKYGA